MFQARAVDGSCLRFLQRIAFGEPEMGQDARIPGITPRDGALANIASTCIFD
jgi:hypothetical protein